MAEKESVRNLKSLTDMLVEEEQGDAKQHVKKRSETEKREGKQGCMKAKRDTKGSRRIEGDTKGRQ